MKLNRATKGQTFQPARINGQKSCEAITLASISLRSDQTYVYILDIVQDSRSIISLICGQRCNVSDRIQRSADGLIQNKLLDSIDFAKGLLAFFVHVVARKVLFQRYLPKYIWRSTDEGKDQKEGKYLPVECKWSLSIRQHKPLR